MQECHTTSRGRSPSGDGKSPLRRKLLCLMGTPVSEGQTLRIHEDIVTIESFGDPFRASRHLARKHGMNIEGERVRYAFLRPATPEETSAVLQEEARDREREASTFALERSLAILRSAPLVQPGTPVPEGDLLWTGRSRTNEREEEWAVLSRDGDIWMFNRDTGEGPRPGANIDPFTFGRRVRPDEEMLASFGVRPEPSPEPC